MKDEDKNPIPDTFPPEEPFAEAQQRKNLPSGYRKASSTELSYDPRMVFELALGVDKPSQIFERWGVEDHVARALIARKDFVADLARYRADIEKDGLSFKTKARIQAEDLLTHSYALAVDPYIPPSVRADMIKWTAKVAGLEPSGKDSGGGGDANGGFQLNITFSGGSQPVTVEGRTLPPVMDAEDT